MCVKSVTTNDMNNEFCSLTFESNKRQEGSAEV